MTKKQKNADRKEREDICKTIEDHFIYLGASDLSTASMDGAIPLDVNVMSNICNSLELLWDKTLRETVGEDESWKLKLLFADNSGLRLMSAEQASRYGIAMQLNRVAEFMKKCGERPRDESETDFVRFYFSKIKEDGSFEKFRTDRRDRDKRITSMINPQALFAFDDQIASHMSSDNLDTTVDFLAHGNKNDVLNKVIMFLSFVGSQRMFWRVKLAIEENVPSMTLLTDATGIKWLWALRDVPPGKKRRAALLNWVSDHWRQLRHDPDIETYVRKHLRGAKKLTQFGIQADIIPSERDELMAQQYKTEREQLRKKKSDRRKRKAMLGTR